MSDELTFRAGAATSNITPSISPDQTVRASKRQATHVHDELHGIPPECVLVCAARSSR